MLNFTVDAAQSCDAVRRRIGLQRVPYYTIVILLF